VIGAEAARHGLAGTAVDGRHGDAVLAVDRDRHVDAVQRQVGDRRGDRDRVLAAVVVLPDQFLRDAVEVQRVVGLALGEADAAQALEQFLGLDVLVAGEGDLVDGRIGKLNPDLFTEYTGNIIRTVATQPFQNNTQSIFVPSIELTVESGVGNLVVSNPVIAMDRSVDGKTWSDQRSRELGKVGEYSRRAIWRRNGRASRFEVFRFTLSDPVRPVIIQLNADILPGAK
jgi:hypothetical protein